MASSIIATSRQTRFQAGSDASLEIDIHDVSITIGPQTEILTSSSIKLCKGVKYVLVGRNGTGKSTILQAIADKTIPGIPSKMKILLMNQQLAKVTARHDESLLEWLVKSNKDLEDTRQKWKMLSEAFESGNLSAPAKALWTIEHQMRMQDLEEARKQALLRSGTRGMKARKELKATELATRESERRLNEECSKIMADGTKKAATMLADLEATLEDLDADMASARGRTLLIGLGFTDTIIDSPITTLSSGNLTRAYLASLLFQHCDMLLLDEPTNFLDLPTLLWLQDNLHEHSATLVLVTHDRAFADAIADEVLVLRDKALERFAGTLSTYHQMRVEKIAYLTKMAESQERQKAHIQTTIANAHLAAKRSGDVKKLSQAKSRQKKLEDRMGMEVSAKGTRFKLNRDLAGYHNAKRPEIEMPKGDLPLRISLPSPPDLVPKTPLISAENLTFRYPSSSNPTLRDITMTVHHKCRIGILGVNGAGKSTLIKLLLGKLRSSAVTQHPRVKCGYYSPKLVEILAEEGRTPLEILGRETEQEGRAALASVGLSGKIVAEVPAKLLSGGQKVRVALAQILNPPPHLLVLDEITTHLDAETVEALAKTLRKWEGAVVIVSHDRWFVRYVVEDAVEDQEGDGETEGLGIGEIWAVVEGRMKKLEGGVTQFEDMVRNGRIK